MASDANGAREIQTGVVARHRAETDGTATGSTTDEREWQTRPLAVHHAATPREVRCPVAIEGMHGVALVTPIIGVSTVLAVRYLGGQLGDWLSGGGRVLEPGTDSDVTAGVFGPLLPPRPDSLCSLAMA